MQQKQTAAQQRTTQIQTAQQQILSAVGLTNYEYCEMQYHCGLSFLAYKCQGEFSEGRIVSSKIFWNWWKTNWAMRDEIFLEDTQNMIVNDNGELILKDWVTKSQYLLTHNPYILSSTVDEYGNILHKAWLQILNIINTEIIKQAV
jgi:hypothetical protein